MPIDDRQEKRQEDRQKQLEQVSLAVRDLPSSPLVEARKKNNYAYVFGEGDANAAVLFVGEAPGEKEARAGRPFVGASGKVLDALLESTGLQRADVYITNVVKDRPPGNRDPSRDEIETYRPFLIRQLEIIRPQVIVTLGRFAMDFILQHFSMPAAGGKISDLHGKLLEAQASYGKIYVLPLYHPAVALYNRDQRQTLEEDFQALKPFVETQKGN